LPTGIKVLPTHWRPEKAKRIATAAENANQLNLRLTRLQEAVQSVFLKAEAAGQSEATVSQADVEAAVSAVRASARRRPKQKQDEGLLAVDSRLTATTPWIKFEERWRAENTHLLAASTLRLYRQVVSSLNEFDTRLRLATLTKERLAQYVGWLYAQGKRDSSVQRHYSFLRECQRLAGLPVPKWLGRLPVRYGRAPTLRRTEVLAMLNAELPQDLAEERDVFMLQLLLLLRDVDLRSLKPHHISAHDLPGYGPTLCVELYQEKTGEPVRIPLPPPAAVIWERWSGKLPMPTQKERNRRLKQLGQVAGLTRDFVANSFSGKVRNEEVMPLWQAVTTHTARHTGAALLILGSEGDQTLKEIGLGHVSASVYGYDTLERTDRSCYRLGLSR
jgi:integrase